MTIDCIEITSTGGTNGIVENTGVSGTIISNNNIHGFTGHGIFISPSSNGWNIEGNTVTDVLTGIYLGNGAHTGTITGNTVSNLSGSTGAAGAAVAIEGSNSNISVTGNTFSTNTVGFYISTVGGDSTGATMENNSFLGNTTQVNNTTLFTFDFSPNWWGTASGTEIQSSISGGNVTFDPWYSDATMTSTSTFGSSTGTTTTATTTTATTTTSTSSLQSQIDSAAHGDTITVPAGTYPGSLLITQQVTLQGTCNSSGTPNATIVGNSGDYAIKIDGAGHVTIDCLNITSLAQTGIGGIVELQSVSGTTVTNNHIFGFNGPAMTVATNSNDFIVNGNTITDVKSGIWLNHGAHHGTIQDNYIHGLTGSSGSEGSAIIFSGANLFIEVTNGNIFENNRIGLYVDNGNGNDDEGTFFRNNSFLNNTASVTNTNLATYDLRLNWWGTASGTEIMLGHGTSSVDFDPWYTDGSMTATSTFGTSTGTGTTTTATTTTATTTTATTTTATTTTATSTTATTTPTTTTGSGTTTGGGGGAASVGSSSGGATGAGMQAGFVPTITFTSGGSPIGVPISLLQFNPLGQVLGAFISQADTSGNLNMGQQVSAFVRNLRLGMRGNDVVKLQIHLKAKGYLNANATGYFGILTRSAVIKWQKANGLPATGFFGPMSRAKINIELSN